MAEQASVLPRILTEQRAALLGDWQRQLAATPTASSGRIPESELAGQTHELLELMAQAVSRPGALPAEGMVLRGEGWQDVCAFLENISRSRAMQGFSSSDTATFVFSLKRPLFVRLAQFYPSDVSGLAADVWRATALLDELGLYTVAAFQRTREDIIQRQQQDLLELSTPVVKVWDGVLALPMIGTLDSARTQIVMESLLQRIVDTGASIAIIDITGVPTVDTLVAQHLLKTVTAIRLMGADCIISGIRPQIAQTIVHLGIELQGVTTRATLADALALALRRNNVSGPRS
jgi:rsbT co-antagonist protein RsbR